tara:strand:- start:1128 stop:1565 length:438 start_codon:yes stop_codon:yes gene_type:complete
MRNTNTGKAERKSFAAEQSSAAADSSADHQQINQPQRAGFFMSAGTLANRELVRDIGIKDTRTPPFQVRPNRTTPHRVFRERLPQKTFLVCMGPIGGRKNFFQKNPLTGPLSSHTVPLRVEGAINGEAQSNKLFKQEVGEGLQEV